MNGRVYDPSIGRMISADPTIPRPFYSQSYNRYAYVYNSPLAFTDPTGYCGTEWYEVVCQVTSTATNVAKQTVSAAGNAISTVGNGISHLSSEYTAGVKSATRFSIEFATHPAINLEYSIPGAGNETNILMRRSATVREIGAVTAAVLSDIWGPEISAGYDAYLADLNGESVRQMGEIFSRNYLELYTENYAINYVEHTAYVQNLEVNYLPKSVIDFINSKTTFTFDSVAGDFAWHYVWDNRLRLGKDLQDHEDPLIAAFGVVSNGPYLFPLLPSALTIETLH
jgi:hypothetical protein